MKNRSKAIILSLLLAYTCGYGQQKYRDYYGFPLKCIPANMEFVNFIIGYFSDCECLSLSYIEQYKDSGMSIRLRLDGFNDLEYDSADDFSSYITINNKAVLLSKNILSGLFLSNWFKPLNVKVIHYLRKDGIKETDLILTNNMIYFVYWDKTEKTYMARCSDFPNYVFLWAYHYLKKNNSRDGGLDRFQSLSQK